jgi:hypothetical protein
MMRRRWARAWAIDEGRWGGYRYQGRRVWAVPPPPTRVEREDLLTRHALRALVEVRQTGPGVWWDTPCGPGIAGYGRYRKRRPFARCCERHDWYDKRAWKPRVRRWDE